MKSAYNIDLLHMFLSDLFQSAMTQILDVLVKIAEPLMVDVLKFAQFVICATNHVKLYVGHFWRIKSYQAVYDQENSENLTQSN